MTLSPLQRNPPVCYGNDFDDAAGAFAEIEPSSAPEETQAAAKAAENKTAAEAKAAAAAQAKYAPGKVKISKAKGTKKKVKVTWKTIKKGVTGYQVSIVNKKTGKVVKTVNVKQTKKLAKKKSIKKTIKKLKKGKYKVRVRAYRTAGSKTYYGTWSRYKSFKVK